MTPIQDAVAAVHDFANQPIVAFPEGDALLLQDGCFKNLLHLCHPPGPARNEALAGLALAITSVPDVFQASRLAMVCGILVEWGADPTIAVSAVLDRLTTQMPQADSIATRITASNETELFATEPDAVKAWTGLRYMIMPTMTMLCLDANLRIAARRREDLVDAARQLAPHHREVKFLDRLFNLSDGDELIVLHALTQRGFRVSTEAIASNFHLFTLLQAAIIGDAATGLLEAPRASRMVIGTATGEIPHDRLVSDSAAFHYGTWEALQPDGTLSAMPMTTWILGEGTPREIPQFEGERVVLLDPPGLASRGWDSSFFSNLHDSLRSKVALVEILSADEVKLRLKRIRNAPRAVS